MAAAATELQRLARAERRVAWCHAKRLPRRTSAVVSAFADRHAVLVLAVTAGWFLLPRLSRRTPSRRKSIMIASALVAQVPRILGLVGAVRRLRRPGTKHAASRPGESNPETRGLRSPEACDDADHGSASSRGMTKGTTEDRDT